MRRTITILTSGTRGDVQPYLALGHGLQRAGQRAVFVIGRREIAGMALPARSLTLERLARAIEQLVTDLAIRSRAHLLGQQLRAEDGVSQAVAFLQHRLG